MRRAYADRNTYLGDPDFVKVPLKLLASDDSAAGLRASINPDHATPSALLPGIGASVERHDTSHISIVDREGNLVAQTQTVNLPYGDAFAVAGTGFLLNDQMDDFSVKPGVPNAFGLVGDDANAIEPGKRPLSSMTPTFLIGADRVAVLGSPGGSRIITRVLLALLDLVDGADAATAVSAPRFHHQYLPDKISIEPGAFTDEELARLAARGFVLSPNERSWGNMQLVVWDKQSGRVEAASDPRGFGVGKGGTTAEEAIYR
jgi:gamma-glutamyltranspeptidase/glutathione hydrolase